MSVSPRQRELIDTLLRERVVPAEVRADLDELMGRAEMAPVAYRPIIDQMMALPRKPREGGGVAVAERVSVSDLLKAKVEKARYAVPVGVLPGTCRDLAAGNDHLFLEVKEYRETRYMRQLHGAPGAFSRTKPSAGQVRDLAAVLDGHCLEYAQLFGKLYTCCGGCGAELTDVVSRQLKLGPECRKRFGL